MTRVEAILSQFEELTTSERTEFMTLFREFMKKSESGQSHTAKSSESGFAAEDLVIARQRMAEIESGEVQTIDEDEFYRRLRARSEAQPTQ